MNLLVDPREGYEKHEGHEVVSNINGMMTVYPLCCSTGVLKSLGATPLTEQNRVQFESKEAITCPSEVVTQIKTATTIHDIVTLAKKFSAPVFYPVMVANWYALSLCLLKATKGTDTGNVGGYSNFKAANITMADRLNSEKRSGKRFNSYNITYSVDHFMEYMDKNDWNLGEWFASKPEMGAHGARTRVGVFTPDTETLQRFHDERIEKVREHVLSWLELRKQGVVQKAADKVAKLW